MKLPTIKEVLDSPLASDWLKQSLRNALNHSPIKTANEAHLLAEILRERVFHEEFGKSK